MMLRACNSIALVRSFILVRPRSLLLVPTTTLAISSTLAIASILAATPAHAFSGARKAPVETSQTGGASSGTSNSQREPSASSHQAGQAVQPGQAAPSAPAGATSSSESIPGAGNAKDLDSVWVSRPDGGQSCSPKSGEALDAVGQELKGAGITVLDSRKGNDGKMRAQMCGVATGGFNSYKISKGDLGKAQALGFQKL